MKFTCLLCEKEKEQYELMFSTTNGFQTMRFCIDEKGKINPFELMVDFNLANRIITKDDFIKK